MGGKEKIRVYREQIDRAEAEPQRLQELTKQQTIAKGMAEAASRVLEELRDTDLDTTTSAEKQDLIAKLGVNCIRQTTQGCAYCLRCASLHWNLQTFSSDNQHGVSDVVIMTRN